MGTVAIVLGLASILGTLVGVWSNNRNNQFIDKTNKENREFQEQTNEQNHKWSQEAAEWEYEHEKPQRQYSDLLAAGLTPAAAAQKITGASVSYSPATAVAPQNMPKSTDMLNDSLQQVFSDIGNYSSMAQAQASAEKTNAETKVIKDTAISKANAEIEKILADTLKSYSDIDVNNANVDLTNEKVKTEQSTQNSIQANIDLTNEKVQTEQVNRRSIELSNDEREIQLDFTRKTLEMSVKKTEAEIKYLSEQTAKLKEEINGINFENAYKSWVNTYIDTYGVSPDQGWQDMLFKAIKDGNADVLLDSFSKSLRLIFSPHSNPKDNPYYYENQKWLDSQEDSGNVYHEHYFGPWRLPRLEHWQNGFFRD